MLPACQLPPLHTGSLPSSPHFFLPGRTGEEEGLSAHPFPHGSSWCLPGKWGGGSHDCPVIPGSLDPRAQIRVCNTWEKGQGGPQGWGRPSEHEEQPWAPLSSGARGQGGVPWRHPGGLRQTSVSPLTPGHSQLYRLGVRLRTGKPSRAVTGLPPSLLIPSSS